SLVVVLKVRTARLTVPSTMCRTQVTTVSPAFARAGLYGALVVKGDCPISRDHSRAVGQSPPARRGRARRWLRAFRPSAILRGFPAACRARRDSLPADRGGRRPLRPNVLAAGLAASSEAPVVGDAARAAGHGAGLAAPLGSSRRR